MDRIPGRRGWGAGANLLELQAAQDTARPSTPAPGEGSVDGESEAGIAEPEVGM